MNRCKWLGSTRVRKNQRYARSRHDQLQHNVLVHRASAGIARASALQEGRDLPVEQVRGLAHKEVARIAYWHIFQIEVELRHEVRPVDHDTGVTLAPEHLGGDVCRGVVTRLPALG